MRVCRPHGSRRAAWPRSSPCWLRPHPESLWIISDLILRSAHLRASRRMKARRPERFPAKWRPVRVKKTRQNKNLEARFDSIEAEMALVERSEIMPSASRFRGNLMFISSESTNKVAIPRVVRSHELRFGLRDNRGIALEKRLSIERSSGPNWLTMAWNAIANQLRN